MEWDVCSNSLYYYMNVLKKGKEMNVHNKAKKGNRFKFKIDQIVNVIDQIVNVIDQIVNSRKKYPSYSKLLEELKNS